MRKLVFYMFASLAVAFAGCSRLELAGVSASVYDDLTEWYSSVVVNGYMTVESSSSYDKVEITSDANVLPYVSLSVRDGVLVIEYDENMRVSSGHYETVVRIPACADVQSVRLRSGAGFISEDGFGSSSTLRFDAGSGSRFVLGGIDAQDVMLNLSGGSSFAAGPVSVTNFSMNFADGSLASVDGDIEYCEAMMEDGSCLKAGTDAFSLSIFRFKGNLSDGSSASFHSDGFVSGTLSDGSSVIASGNAEVDIREL